MVNFLCFKILCVVFLAVLESVWAAHNVSEEQYSLMPPVFQIDDYDRCMQLGADALYCEIKFELQPEDPSNTSEIWNIISAVSREPKYYRHDWLRHGVCVTTSCPDIPHENYYIGKDNASFMQELSTCYSEKYSHLGMKGVVTYMHCESIEPFYKVDGFDIAVAVGITIFVCILIFASFYEGLARYKTPEEYKRITESPAGKIISCFSIVKNWQRLRSENTNPDAVRMKVIQGVRFFNMICVILAHACMMVFHAPVTNPMYNEHTTDKTLNMFVANGGYVVQTFYAISGWLVAYHFFEMSEGKKSISFGYVIFGFINRYIRLIPALLTVYLLSSTWMVHSGRGPYWDRLVGEEYRNCRNNGWSNLLFINNYYNKEHMCLQQTWYMATDTQVFVIAIIVAWMMKTYEKYAVRIVAGAITVATIIPMVVSYVYNFDILVRQYPEPLYDLLLKVPQWHIMFSSGYCNMAGYMVGVLFGYIFFKNREKQVFTSKVYTTIWWITVWVVPITVILIAAIMYDEDFHYTRVGAAFYAGISRTLFAAGIMLALWGMSQKQGWFMEMFCTWDAVQIFGRLTYCAYLVHVNLLRLRAGRLRSPMYVTDYILVFDTLGDVTLAYLVATVLCVCVEMPVSALQKFMIPQRKSRTELSRDKHVNGSGKRFNGESNYKL